MKVESRKLKVKSGKWKVESRKWQVESFIHYKLSTLRTFNFTNFQLTKTKTKIMKKIIISIFLVLALIIAGYFTFIYYASYSEGYRAGELIKFSKKGLLFKTWEGELSQGVSESQRFVFSVEHKEKQKKF